MSYSFDYGFTTIGDLQVETEEDKNGKPFVTAIVANGERLAPSRRFWTSLFSKFGITNSIFKYYDHREVFDRIAAVEQKSRLRFCVERPTGMLLAVSNPEKPVVAYSELMGMLQRYGGDHILYHDGMVSSIHTPRNVAHPSFTDRLGKQRAIGADNHVYRFCMSTPVDGYGLPNIYLAMKREACNNNIIMMTKAFKASLQLGKSGDDVQHSVIRALDGYSNEEGYAAMVQRMESAAESWASIAEAQSLYKLLIKLHATNGIIGDETPIPGGRVANLLGINTEAGFLEAKEVEDQTINSPTIKAFHRLTGDTAHLYGMANLDALSLKRQRTLPVGCSVYGLVVLATEIATHYATAQGYQALSYWVGELLGSGNEFDMEGTGKKFTEFDDFLVQSKANAAPELAAVS